jgi:hypothetical protein
VSEGADSLVIAQKRKVKSPTQTNRGLEWATRPVYLTTS